ncbi:glycosyltransferase family 4 protein [Methylomonas methanica]|uniref:Glycosyl transferase group 1 n=1 Tax=Methylomonas methanica (strain DSM 25384 / MC09) TaxID=857087 RepID=F9ZW36_METMM|nr:glycosyltransferase family 4 protein [Methylomonas methanica]AEG02007.1 glycosyl transferase group 1 [Methylomonas methanica MC09]
MRILHFFKTAFPETMGGIEQVIDQIARGAAGLGIDTDVLYLSPEPNTHSIEVHGYRIHRVRRDCQFASTGFSAAVFSRFKQLAQQADIIHYHFPWPFMDLVHFACRVEKPCLLTYHSDIIRQQLLLRLYRPLMTRFMRDVDSIVATSPNYLATSPVLRNYAAKISVIPIGLDRSGYAVPSAARLRYWREKLGERFFLFVGVLRYYKGLHILLDAAKNTDIAIAIVGAGPTEYELKSKAARLNLRHIHFFGYLPEEDKAALLTLCYGVIFPSHLRSEAFGITLLEGAMHGKPMISCEIGTGTTYVNIGGTTGLVVPPNDPEALRSAMLHLLDNPAQAAELGRGAEQRYRNYFTGERMVNSYVALYRDLSLKSLH